MPFFATLHVIDDNDSRSAAMNMAIDEALLELCTAPTLRFYEWRTSSVSFGYFGNYIEVAREEPSREIVRRWTGGGSVLHGSDLTYSITLPAKPSASLPPSRTIYAHVHKAIRDLLADSHQAMLARMSVPKISGACFTNPVSDDVLVGERKIAGAAQRRTRAGLLHQGSIQLQPLPPDFPQAFAAALSAELRSQRITPEVNRRAAELSKQKYGNSEWLRRR
ncbi:MAG: hypothetical protein M3Y80_06965 [Verrucomicrobiota bacterium]|nr:hypothetical protein [Verrucomicrobiota bacterium]